MSKILISLLMICFFASCRNEQKNIEPIENPTISSQNFDWVLGEWKRSNEQAGKETFETWKKVSDNEYLGLGYTMENSDTIWKENITLINRDTVWNFEVTGKGESQPTIFLITNIEEERFESENQENEFPKVISYFREGRELHAVISGGGTEILFLFEAVKNK